MKFLCEEIDPIEVVSIQIKYINFLLKDKVEDAIMGLCLDLNDEIIYRYTDDDFNEVLKNNEGVEVTSDELQYEAWQLWFNRIKATLITNIDLLEGELDLEYSPNESIFLHGLECGYSEGELTAFYNLLSSREKGEEPFISRIECSQSQFIAVMQNGIWQSNHTPIRWLREVGSFYAFINQIKEHRGIHSNSPSRIFKNRLFVKSNGDQMQPKLRNKISEPSKKHINMISSFLQF